MLLYSHEDICFDFHFLKSLSGFHENDQFPTATYCAVLDHRGELYCAIGDMDVNQSINVEWVSVLSSM